jgi:hypothetical protein
MRSCCSLVIRMLAISLPVRVSNRASLAAFRSNYTGASAFAILLPRTRRLDNPSGKREAEEAEGTVSLTFKKASAFGRRATASPCSLFILLCPQSQHPDGASSAPVGAGRRTSRDSDSAQAPGTVPGNRRTILRISKQPIAAARSPSPGWRSSLVGGVPAQAKAGRGEESLPLARPRRHSGPQETRRARWAPVV